MNPPVLESNAQTSVVVRAFQSDSVGPMPAEVARYLVNLRPAAEDVQRANELAAKARAGQLTTDEQAEIEERRRVGKLFEAIRLLAQVTLRRADETGV